MSAAEEAYLNAVRTVLREGTRKENRTGVDTISTFDVSYKIDLQRGFPLLTTKKISWKNIVVEMLWFLSGQTHIGVLEKHGCKFWSAWADKETGEVPSAYGYFFRQFPAEHRLVQVPIRRMTPEPQMFIRRHFPQQETGRGRWAGQTFASETCGEYTVLDEMGRDGDGRSLHVVQFRETGFSTTVRADVVQAGTIRDPFYPTVCGVGHVGSYELKTNLDHNLYKVWSHMIERCYNANCKEFELYGAKGIFVCDRWLSFTNFREDCSSMPGWLAKSMDPRSRQIDKDYYSSNYYSKETCVWITKRDNIRYQNARAFEVTTPDGETFIDISRNDVADALDLSPSCITDVLAGRQTATKGYKFQYLDGVSYRYPFPNDQIKFVVDTLKRDPMSRRMVVSAWAPGNAQTSKLPPCHCQWIVNVQNFSVIENYGGNRSLDTEKRLCLHLTQRSCDMALGIPYNIASYALLMHLLSRFSGIPVGVFGHALVDAHVYSAKPDGSMAEFDHVPGLLEQLEREPRPLPTLRIDDSVQSLDDVPRLLELGTEELMQLFELAGYSPHPTINFKVAV